MRHISSFRTFHTCCYSAEVFFWRRTRIIIHNMEKLSFTDKWHGMLQSQSHQIDQVHMTAIPQQFLNLETPSQWHDGNSMIDFRCNGGNKMINFLGRVGRLAKMLDTS